jgi:hypothetical protein
VRLERFRKRLRPHWYRVLELSPVLYSAYLRKGNQRSLVATPDTDLVVAGYPAAGNTFAREAMLHANPGLRIASHVHSWTQVAQAVRLGLPTLLLVRDPTSAVSSVLVRFPDCKVTRELKNFSRFYRRALPFVGQVVVVDFDAVTSRFGDVVHELNRRFGTNFIPFFHNDPASTAAVFARIDEYDRSQFGDAATIRTARPTMEKELRKDWARQELSSDRLRPWVERCDAVYAQLLAVAGPLRRPSDT